MNEPPHPLTLGEILDHLALSLFYFDQGVSSPPMPGVPLT